MITLVTENSSYELPSSYNTPNITFPKPIFLVTADQDIPDPYTGIVLELTDKATTRSINDATVQMYYYDDQLGNRSTIMQNVGGGRYYSLLPTNDSEVNDYFNSTNLLSTISQQGNAFMELLRAYPISDICFQISMTANVFCSLIVEDMTLNIPNSLNAASKYTAQIPMQSKPPGQLSDFQVVVLIPGEQPITILLDNSSEIISARLFRRANSGYAINPNVLTGFSSKVGGSRGKCNEQTVAGNDTPDDRVIDVGKAHTVINFRYETYIIKDQMDVYYKNQLVQSSSCIGTQGERVTVIALNDAESSLRVNVIPDCAGETGTAWYYTIECSFNELICNSGLCYCGAKKRSSIQTTAASSNGCGSDNSWGREYIREKGDSLKFTPYCNDHDACYGTCNRYKSTCDQEFLQAMQASCLVNWVNATDIQNCQKWANRFYTAVNWLGGSPFETAQEADCMCATTNGR